MTQIIKSSLIYAAIYTILYITIIMYSAFGMPINLLIDRIIMAINPTVYIFSYISSFGSMYQRFLTIILGGVLNFVVAFSAVYIVITISKKYHNVYIILSLLIIIWLLWVIY